jgi:hypothetical protein
MLAHSQIQKGKIVLNHYMDSDDLTFRLQSPSLTVTDVDLDVPAEQLAKVHELLQTNGNALVQGGPYDHDRESGSVAVIDLLLRSTGRRAKVSRTIYLDYRRKTARVAFKIWDVPPGVPQRLTPPYKEPCKIMIGNFNWLDVDDLTPESFLERKMRTKWLGCYSDSDVRLDTEQLNQMTFLKEADISVEGSGDSRSIAVHARGNPVPISKVRVRGYGLLEGLRESDLPPLSIHPGDIYSRSNSSATGQLLTRPFPMRERQVMVYSDVEINEQGKAELNFSVLGYPDDVVYIDGERFDNPPLND